MATVHTNMATIQTNMTTIQTNMAITQTNMATTQTNMAITQRNTNILKMYKSLCVTYLFCNNRAFVKLLKEEGVGRWVGNVQNVLILD